MDVLTLLSYSNSGWSIFPLLPRSKLPATTNGFKDATNHFGKIMEWHSANSEYNWGLATGKLIVIDVDPKNGGSLDSLSGLPQTLIAKTGSGGCHLYYKNSGLDIRNSVSKLAPGVDVRGQGGYVVLPPSTHPNGNKYEWLTGINSLVEVPKILRDKLEVIKVTAARFIQPELITNGGRNDTLFRLACSLKTRGLLDESILAAILIENKRRCSPPLEEEEIEKIVQSSARYDKETHD
jgi:hypothetical protein